MWRALLFALSILPPSICVAAPVVTPIDPRPVPPIRIPVKKAILIRHNDWSSAITETENALKARGYAVAIYDKAADGRAAIQNMRNTLVTHDRLFVYLAGHGSDPRAVGDWSHSPSRNHYVQFNTGDLYVSDVDGDFATMANNGVLLTVVDGSCNGGETVVNAMGQNYCALSTVAVKAPGLTNFPSPGKAIQTAGPGNPARMGFWTNSKSQVASVLNGLLVPHIGDRIPQRIHRNDTCRVSETSEFARPALGWKIAVEQYNWGIRVGNYSIFKVIYPTEYKAMTAAEKAKFTNPTSNYLAFMNELDNAGHGVLENLKSQLRDDVTNASAAKVYSNGYISAWRTMAGDLTWNVTDQPTYYDSVLHSVNPADYAGEAGFTKMSFELLTLIQTMEEGFNRQIDLLSKIDAAYTELQSLTLTPRLRIPPIERLAAPIDRPVRAPLFGLDRLTKLELEKHDQRALSSINQYERGLGRGTRATDVIVKVMRNSSPSTDPRVLANRILDQSVSAYQNYGKVVVEVSPELLRQLRVAQLKTQLEAMIPTYKALTPVLTRTLERMNILLSIYEDSVCAVQSGGKNPCDQVSL